MISIITDSPGNAEDEKLLEIHTDIGNAFSGLMRLNLIVKTMGKLFENLMDKWGTERVAFAFTLDRSSRD